MSRFLCALLVVAAGMFVGCDKGDKEKKAVEAPPKKKMVNTPEAMTIGLIGKSQSNPVFQAARRGANDAAKELGAKYHVNITIDWRTPPTEDATKQAEAIRALSRGDASGIAIACSEANTVTPAINEAVDNGVTVVCFDSDAPKSKRMSYYGSNNEDYGVKLMADLAKEMDEKGTIAILSGNQSAPNLQQRVDGVRKELKKHAQMKELQVFYLTEETPEIAANTIKLSQNTHPEIEGWVFVGGWPLFTKGALPWEPGKVKAVSADALPPELPYLEDGRVQVLWAQDCYGWGHKSVEVLVEKIANNKAPAETMMADPLKRVTKENVEEVRKQWEQWTK
ncbi:MAG TPA: substrate-binding domain-containing protein [Tepidisphaeraceae bacterium]